MKTLSLILLAVFGLLLIPAVADARVPHVGPVHRAVNRQRQEIRHLNAIDRNILVRDLRSLDVHRASLLLSSHVGYGYHEARALLLAGSYGYVQPDVTALRLLPADPAPVDPTPYVPPSTGCQAAATISARAYYVPTVQVFRVRRGY